MIPSPFSDPSKPFKFGVDCSALDGVLDVACVSGRCDVTRCARGFEVSPNGNECLPNQQDTANSRPTRTIALPFGKADINLTMGLAGALQGISATTSIPTQRLSPSGKNGGHHPNPIYVPAQFPKVPTAALSMSNSETRRLEAPTSLTANGLINGVDRLIEGQRMAIGASVSMEMTMTMSATQTMA